MHENLLETMHALYMSTQDAHCLLSGMKTIEVHNYPHGAYQDIDWAVIACSGPRQAICRCKEEIIGLIHFQIEIRYSTAQTFRHDN